MVIKEASVIWLSARFNSLSCVRLGRAARIRTELSLMKLKFYAKLSSKMLRLPTLISSCKVSSLMFEFLKLRIFIFSIDLL